MDKEPIENIGLIHAHCAEERKDNWQKANESTVIPIGDYAKICFTEGKHKEHMWLKVTYYDPEKRNYIGILDSDPVYITRYKCGDAIGFNHKDIEEQYHG